MIILDYWFAPGLQYQVFSNEGKSMDLTINGLAQIPQTRNTNIMLHKTCLSMLDQLSCWISNLKTNQLLRAQARFSGKQEHKRTVEWQIFRCRKLLRISRISQDLQKFPACEYYLNFTISGSVSHLKELTNQLPFQTNSKSAKNALNSTFDYNIWVGIAHL